MLVIFFIVLLQAEQSVESTKPYQLDVLSMLMFTGYQPRDNRLCQASIDLVAEIVNDRADLLPDYHLFIDHRNEGPGGAMTIPSAIDFQRKWESARQTSFPSPIMMGPFLSPACKAWGAAADHLNMVLIGGSCTSPVQTARRNLYANMYRIRGPAELSVYARLYYLKMHTSIRKFAILFNLANSFNQEVANLLYNQALNNGFEIQAYEAISIDMMSDDLILSLKRRNVRIIAIDSEANVGLHFLCLAYKNGLKGERYLFVFFMLGYVNVYNLADSFFKNCDRQMMVEQAMRSIFVGATLEATLPIEKRTNLGHSLSDFEELFGAKTNHSKTADYDFRHLCYDRMLAAVIMLNDTENRLAKQNLTIRDYVKKPREVMLVANESARNLQYSSLRFGDFRYSDRVEWDLEPQLVTSFSNITRDLVIMEHVKCRDNMTATNLSAFETVLDLDSDFQIYLPSDGPKVKTEEVDISWAMLYIICSLSGSFALFEIAIAFLLFKKMKSKDEFLFYKTLVLIGCVCLNIASILLSLRNTMKNTAVCRAQIIFPAIGIAFVHFSIASKLYQNYKSYRPDIRNLNLWRTTWNPTNRTRIKGRPSPNINNSETRIGYVAATCMGCFMNSCFVIGWLIESPLKLEKYLPFEPVYNERDDLLTTFWAFSCETRGFGWLVILLCWNAVPIIVGLLTAVKLRKVSVDKEDTIAVALWKYDVRSFLQACVCASTLYVSLIAVVFILSDNQRLQMIALSFGMMVYSIVVCMLIFRSWFFKK